MWAKNKSNPLLGLLDDVFLETMSLFLTLFELDLHHLDHLIVLLPQRQILEWILMQRRSLELLA